MHLSSKKVVEKMDFRVGVASSNCCGNKQTNNKTNTHIKLAYSY